jgi:sugar phosphate isomerase/epimerase
MMDINKPSLSRRTFVGAGVSTFALIRPELVRGSGKERLLCACLPTALSVVRAAAHQNAGVCLDTFHFFVGPSKTEDLADLKPGEIAHVHFHDVPGSVPRERLADADRLPPGEGCLPLDRITAALRSIGYRGALSVELFGTGFHTGVPKAVAERC